MAGSSQSEVLLRGRHSGNATSRRSVHAAGNLELIFNVFFCGKHSTSAACTRANAIPDRHADIQSSPWWRTTVPGAVHLYYWCPWSMGTAFCRNQTARWSVTEHFRLPPLKYGTLYRNTSSQLPRCSPSGVTLKHFYNIFSACNTLVDLVVTSVTVATLKITEWLIDWLKLCSKDATRHHATLSGYSSSWPFLHIDVSTERHRRIWPTNSSSPRIPGSEPAYDRHRPHHCRSTLHGCRLSATELFLSPLPAPGTTCCVTSRPHYLCLFLKASEIIIWQRCQCMQALPAFFSATFVQCLRSDCHYWHSNRSLLLFSLLY